MSLGRQAASGEHPEVVTLMDAPVVHLRGAGVCPKKARAALSALPVLLASLRLMIRSSREMRSSRRARRRPASKNPDELRLPRLAVSDKDVPAGAQLSVDELVQADRAVGYISL